MITSKPVLAFLQNMWVRDPEGMKRSWERMGRRYGPEMMEESRLRCISYALFAGCKTGKVLKRIFGEDLVEKIRWEESTREIADNYRQTFPADPEHIRAAIDQHNPKVVIAFGQIAVNAVRPFCVATLTPFRPHRPFIAAPHPAAIGKKYTEQLMDAAAQLKAILAT